VSEASNYNFDNRSFLCSSPSLSDRGSSSNVLSGGQSVGESRRFGEESSHWTYGARFQTQPITVDEVEQARREFGVAARREHETRERLGVIPRLSSPFEPGDRSPGVPGASPSPFSPVCTSSGTTAVFPSGLNFAQDFPVPAPRSRWRDDLDPEPDKVASPSSPVRASPARVIPSESSNNSSPEESPRPFYFRPVSRSPNRNRPASWRSNSSPPPLPPSPPPTRHSPPPRRKFSSPVPSRPLVSPPPNLPPSPASLEPSSPVLRRRKSSSPQGESGILRNVASGHSSGILNVKENILGSSFKSEPTPVTSELKTPKKSILKKDSVDDKIISDHQARGVLKKDTSYEGSLSRNGSIGSKLSSSSSSNEDLAQTFSDVIIDPVPGLGRRSAPETPIKRVFSRTDRPGLVHQGSVKISADGNLASKLAHLAGQADNFKQQQMAEQGTSMKTYLRNPTLQLKSSSVDSELKTGSSLESRYCLHARIK